MRCRRCRYPLQSVTTRRCPECGRPFDPDDPSTYRPDVDRPRHPSILKIMAVIVLWQMAASLIVAAGIFHDVFALLGIPWNAVGTWAVIATIAGWVYIELPLAVIVLLMVRRRQRR